MKEKLNCALNTSFKKAERYQNFRKVLLTRPLKDKFHFLTNIACLECFISVLKFFSHFFHLKLNYAFYLHEHRNIMSLILG